MEKNTVDDLKKYLIHCIDQEGIINGKRKFSLQLGLLENALFNDMDEFYSSVYHLAEYSNIEDTILEELPVVDDYGDIVFNLIAVS